MGRPKAQGHPLTGWRFRLHEIIFEADTPAGKFFDIGLIACIGLSVVAVMLDSVQGVQQRYGGLLWRAEWFFTGLFTVEYLLRLVSVGRPRLYATSFFGLVDLAAILPTYISMLVPGSQYLLVVRILRILRVFRVFKLAQYVTEASQLMQAMRASQRKITVFLFAISAIVVICGSLMYLIEGEQHGFTSIPRSVYWAVVTLTTVGYGDISPQTGPGQALAAMIMIMGYAIIAVPTGIVVAEITHIADRSVSTQACPQCSGEGHDHDAEFCKYCGACMEET